MKKHIAPEVRWVGAGTHRVRRREPDSYDEWNDLRLRRPRSGQREGPPGYLLRAAREAAGVTQVEMGRRLGSSQQAVAQAERRKSNPTVRFLSDWAQALDLELSVVVGIRSGDEGRRPER